MWLFTLVVACIVLVCCVLHDLAPLWCLLIVLFYYLLMLYVLGGVLDFSLLVLYCVTCLRFAFGIVVVDCFGLLALVWF